MVMFLLSTWVEPHPHTEVFVNLYGITLLSNKEKVFPVVFVKNLLIQRKYLWKISIQ